MLHGKRIEHCPFIPFVIPHAKSVDYRKISKILQFEDQKPHLIYLANSTFEKPPYIESVIIHVLYFCDFKKRKSTYYDFLDIAFAIISNSPNKTIPFIGVASRSSPDFCEFFIARWLINECGYTINESLDMVRKSLPPGIVKKKFIHQLSRLYSHLEIKKPVQTKETINNTEQNESINKMLGKQDETEKEKANKQVTDGILQKKNSANTQKNENETHQNQNTEMISTINENQPSKSSDSSQPNTYDTVHSKEKEDAQQMQDQNHPTVSQQQKQQQIYHQQQISESANTPDIYQHHQHQVQIQMQQRQQQQQEQILLQTLQSKAQELYQYQNKVKQLLQEFQANPYDYQQQNINYQYQLQSSLKEAAIRLQPIELQIKQIQANQQVQQQQQQQMQQPQQSQQQEQQSSPKLMKKSSSASLSHSDSLAVENDQISKQNEPINYNSNLSSSINTSSSTSKVQTIPQNQPQVIEQTVIPQHATMYFNEIEKMMNVPHKKCLFTKFAPMTLSQLEIIKSDILKSVNENNSEPATYCIMPEPKGIRAILYLRRKVPLLIFQDYSPIQLKLNINTSDEDLYIFEVIYVRYSQPNIVLCDIMFAKDEDVSSRPFNYRIGIIKNCYEQIFKPLNDSVIKFTIRPFYRLKDYRLLTDLFEKNPHKQFTRYPVAGISATLVNSGNCHSSKCMYLWTKDVIENPRVIIEVDFGSKSVFGFARSGSTSAIIAYLGKLTPELFNLNGKVVEIEVLDQDPSRPFMLNAKIIKVSDNYPWTTSKFMKYYPEREPHMDIQGLNDMLETLASIT